MLKHDSNNVQFRQKSFNVENVLLLSIVCFFFNMIMRFESEVVNISNEVGIQPEKLIINKKLHNHRSICPILLCCYSFQILFFPSL